MAPRGLFQSDRSYRLALPVLIFLYLVVQIPRAKDLVQNGIGLTPDDAMRLVEVRDLLGGQAWYDLIQHRVLPPDGLSMHWSRYIDAPMAAIMAAVTPLAGPDMAARILAILWPLSMGLVFLLLTAGLTRRLFGNQAAFLSLMVMSYYELLSGSGFGAGATDHHSAQINLMLGLAAMLVLPERPGLRGAIGGCLAALSLAIGLEMIFFVAFAGLALVGAQVLGRAGADRRLMGFATALALGCPLLMAGQLSPALWVVPVCDALSPPLLAITTTAFLASAVLLAASHWSAAPLIRLTVVLLCGAVAAVTLFPLVQPCLAGPYTAMSAELQRTVLSQIEEIKPAGFYLAHDLGRGLVLLVPFYVATLLFAASVFANRGKGALLLAFVAAAALLSFWQIRMMTMGLPLVALALGAGASWALSQDSRAIKATGIAAVLFVLLSKPIGIGYLTLTWDGPGPIKGNTSQSEDCATIDTLAKLDSLPPGIVFNPLNLGPLILLASHHSVTSAPYHRSADAFANGVLPFMKDEAALRAAVDKTRADYVLVCKGDIYAGPDSIGSQLGGTGTPGWLRDVPLNDTHLRLLQVQR